MTFTKLFSSITESTVWCEDSDTRVIWITMLAMCNKNGYVFASEPGLASRAKVPLAAVLSALDKFQQPDKYSRSKEYEGRRIEAVDGGWRLLNYIKHRAIRDEEERKEYLKLYMRQRRKQLALTKVNKVNHSKPPSTHTEADSREQIAEADAISSKSKNTARKLAQSIPENFQPNEYHRNLAKKMGVDLGAAFVQFRDHHGARGTTFKDWNLALNTWIRNTPKFAIHGASNGNGNGQYKSPAQLREERNKAALQRAITEIDDPANQSESFLKGID
jgi:hypothetical protein